MKKEIVVALLAVVFVSVLFVSDGYCRSRSFLIGTNNPDLIPWQPALVEGAHAGYDSSGKPKPVFAGVRYEGDRKFILGTDGEWHQVAGPPQVDGPTTISDFRSYSSSYSRHNSQFREELQELKDSYFDEVEELSGEKKDEFDDKKYDLWLEEQQELNELLDQFIADVIMAGGDTDLIQQLYDEYKENRDEIYQEYDQKIEDLQQQISELKILKDLTGEELSDKREEYQDKIKTNYEGQRDFYEELLALLEEFQGLLDDYKQEAKDLAERFSHHTDLESQDIPNWVLEPGEEIPEGYGHDHWYDDRWDIKAKSHVPVPARHKYGPYYDVPASVPKLSGSHVPFVGPWEYDR